MNYDCIIHGALILDGSGAPGVLADLAIHQGLIAAVGQLQHARSHHSVDGSGLVLAPGFIDVHTHDDLEVIRAPEMLPKISQGVTTVIAGNCGISASPVTLTGALPDPMNLLGSAAEFCYADFSSYVAAVERAQPAVNVAALIGHTALRSNHLNRLDRCADKHEITQMRAQLADAMAQGALGLSTGLAYSSAIASDAHEVQQLAEVLRESGGVYTTHLRTEFDGVLDAVDEAFAVGRAVHSPVIVSHIKCAGAGNWGRSGEVLAHLEAAASKQLIGCDCYPYSASSSTLDLQQVTGDYDIVITWSDPHPKQAGRTLASIAQSWQMSLLEAAQKLQPAGAVYHGMSEQDLRNFLAHPLTMIGSDGLPADPLPHPRLWGAFPRVLGHYSRDLKLFSLSEAVHKMTRLSADRFGLRDRGRIQVGACADLVLFDAAKVRDSATYSAPQQVAEGIAAVWVNGVLSYRQQSLTGARAGRFLRRQENLSEGFRLFNDVSVQKI